MATENPNFSPQPEQVEGKFKSLTLAFRKCCDRNSFSGNDRKECPFYKEIAEFYGYRPNGRAARMRQAAARGRRIEKSRHFSEPAVSVAKVAKRQKKSANFFVQQTANSSRISRISGIIVRLANEKLTFSGMYFYSGISQTNAPLVKIHISCSFYEIVASRNPQYFTHSASEQQKKLLS